MKTDCRLQIADCIFRGNTKLFFQCLMLIALCFLLFAGPTVANDTSAVEARLTGFIKQFYNDREDVQVKLNRLPDTLRDKVTIKRINFAKMPDESGDGLCIVEIYGRNKMEQNVYVPFKVVNKKRLFVLKQEMKRGDVIGQRDILVRETYLNERAATAYPAKAEDVIGKVAKRDLLPGTILTTQALEDSILVQRGEIVNIVINNRKLLVQTKGKALDKGKMGDTIRVKNISSNKDIVGKVTGSGSVSVDL